MCVFPSDESGWQAEAEIDMELFHQVDTPVTMETAIGTWLHITSADAEVLFVYVCLSCCLCVCVSVCATRASFLWASVHVPVLDVMFISVFVFVISFPFISATCPESFDSKGAAVQGPQHHLSCGGWHLYRDQRGENKWDTALHLHSPLRSVNPFNPYALSLEGCTWMSVFVCMCFTLEGK